MTRARIRWLPASEGGRASPPAGSEYSTVARFERLREKWPQEAWSVVLVMSEPINEDGTLTCEIRMLTEAGAPAALLSQGSRFDLFEGSQKVAEGYVL